MPGLNIPNTIDVNTTADAVEVEQNFSVIESWVNHDAIRRDGGVAMDAPLLLNAGDPTEDNHAANKNYVDALMPIGTIMLYGGVGAPAGDWHLCDGTSLAAASYPVLYGVLNVRYGGSGGTFNLPNFAARMPIGRDTTQSRFDTTGKTGGSTTVPVPSHTHTINHDHGSQSTGGSAADSVTTAAAGVHDHSLRYDAVNPISGTGGGYVAKRWSDTSGTTPVGGTDSAPSHSHTLTLPSHTHSFNVSNYAGASGAFEKKVDLAYATNGVLTEPVSGRETTTELIPMYVVVQYIIRVDPQ